MRMDSTSKKGVVFAFNLAKIFLIFFCFLLFFVLMYDVWDKYDNYYTTTGIGYTPGEGEKQVLPCLIVRPIAAYKKHGFYFTDKDYDENTFQLEDIFHSETVKRLKNASEYFVETINTLVYGKCFRICYLEELLPQTADRLVLKRDKDYLVYTLGHGEEFWLVMPSRYHFYFDHVTFERPLEKARPF